MTFIAAARSMPDRSNPLIGSVKDVLYEHITALRSKEELTVFPRELLATILTGMGTEAVRHEVAAGTSIAPA